MRPKDTMSRNKCHLKIQVYAKILYMSTCYVYDCICSISVIINVKYAHRKANIPSMNGTLVPQASAQRVVEGGWCSLRPGGRFCWWSPGGFDLLMVITIIVNYEYNG